MFGTGKGALAGAPHLNRVCRNALRMRAPLAVSAILLVMLAPAAHAHPFTEETWPNAENNGEEGTSQVWVIYSERVVLEFSSLKVYDDTGSQIDNRDTAYHTDENSLIVTTPPLKDGIYTVASKVLSAVDGHLVPYTFVFAVGGSSVDPALHGQERELVYLPEAAARFFGLVGQALLFGAAVGGIIIWRTQDMGPVRSRIGEVSRAHHGKFMLITGISLIMVLASTIMVLMVVTVRLGAFSADTLQTPFGMAWVARMAITAALLAVWFAMERGVNRPLYALLLALSAALLMTSALIGHGAATDMIAPVILDFAHVVVAAVWIGGLGYMYFVMRPALAVAGSGREGLLTVMVPRFSAIFVLGIGVVLITGPILMWFLESDVGAITGSLYGKLIMAKIALASAMIALGGYTQLATSKSVGKSDTRIFQKMQRLLGIEFGLGVALLLVVALLINSTLPAGEAGPAVEPGQEGFETARFAPNTKFEVAIEPYTTGLNGIYVRAAGLDGSPLAGQEGVRVKVSNPAKNIFPVSVDMEPVGQRGGVTEYGGEAVFGFAGTWVVEVESQQGEGGNESVILRLPVKPDTDSIRADITEYPLPEDAKPLHPVYADGTIWVSDPSAPRIWSFDPATEEFGSFAFEGGVSLFLDVDGEGNVWFTDAPGGRIGYLQPESGQFTMVEIPQLPPLDAESLMVSILADHDGRYVWVAVATKDAILRYDRDAETFEAYDLKAGSFPFALASGPDGNVWFSASGNGDIGYVRPDTGEVRTFAAPEPLESPEHLLFDGRGVLWISEHSGAGLAAFDVATERFFRAPLDVPDGLPYGASLDSYGNIWVAQHTADVIAMYDPDRESYRHFEIPTAGSFAQFTTADGDGNVWFVEQQGNKLARVVAAGIPSAEVPPRATEGSAVLYTEVASPLMAAGILAAALFFVKSVHDKRRAEEALLG